MPDGPSDVATFAASSQPSVIIRSNIELGQIVFAEGASAFTITIQSQKSLSLGGVGVSNNSVQEQNFVLQAKDNGAMGVINLENTATTGSNTVFTCAGSLDSLLHGGSIGFYDTSSAGESMFVLNGGAANGAFGGDVAFSDNSTAADATFTVEGGATPGALGGSVRFGFGTFGNMTSAGHATIIANGGTSNGARGGAIYFFLNVTAAEPTLIANGGVNGGTGAFIYIESDIPDNLARVQLFGDGLLNISSSFNTTIGSLEGDGMVDLGDFTLTVGGNNQNTSFSGLIEQVNTEGGSGAIKKVGSGTLRLSHANTFKGGITVAGGTVVIENQTGSGSGSGGVTVQEGRLAGNGIIAGGVSIGTGTGAGAFLAPGGAASQPRTLTLNDTTFEADATYTYKLNTKNAKADQVIADGVTIETGARFTINAIGNRKLAAGRVFTAISNTFTNPISGTFSNLPDDGTITVGRNTFQANYEGGDGNDLTLTVVP